MRCSHLTRPHESGGEQVLFSRAAPPPPPTPPCRRRRCCRRRRFSAATIDHEGVQDDDDDGNSFTTNNPRIAALRQVELISAEGPGTNQSRSEVRCCPHRTPPHPTPPYIHNQFVPSHSLRLRLSSNKTTASTTRLPVHLTICVQAIRSASTVSHAC